MSVATREPSVLIVDDVPENLTLLGAILGRENYQITLASSGAEALQSVHQSAPDIVLLDISMPEMDGYQVCQAFKSDEQLCRIPVIFISALTQIQEIVKGFEVGGQDYITKPFRAREVKERVRTHLDLAWTRQELEETLDQTLTGSIKVITDFMGFVNPKAFSGGIRIKQNMTALVDQLELTPKRWFELAAVMSQLGLAAVKPSLQEKYTLQMPLTSSDKEEMDHSVELIATMLKSIPRLELVAEMIAHHKLTLKLIGNKPFEEMETAEQGGMILNLLEQYDQLSLKGKSPSLIISLLKKDKDFPEILTQALKSIQKDAGELETRCCAISELVSGMILQEDIVDIDGRTLLKSGVQFSDTIVNAINFQQNRLAKTMLMVKIVPKSNKSFVAGVI